MKVPEGEAAVSTWKSSGAQTKRQHGVIMQCAWRLDGLVALATLDLLY